MARSFSIQQALDNAVVHHAAGRLPQAERGYQQILRTSPNQPVALHLLGVIAHQRGNNEVAVEFITKAVAIVPNYAEAHSNLGNALQDLGNLDEAVVSYRIALVIAPNYPEAHNNLGNALRDMGKPDEAVTNYLKALAINPDYASAHYNLGNALKDSSKLDEAVVSYTKSIAINPDFANAHNNLGAVFMDLGKLHEAVASYQRALALVPDSVESHYNLAAALKELGKLDDAVASYQKALAIAPGYAEAHNNLGNVLRDMGKPDDAIASFHQALAIAPDLAEAHSNLGNVFMAQGKLDDAVACYRKALAIAPDYAEAHRHLANVSKFTEYDDDIKAMEVAYAMPDLSDQQKMHLAFGLGKSFEDIGRYEKAFGFYQSANAIKRGTYAFSTATVEMNFERLKAVFTENLFSRHQAAGSSDESPIFILGMPRSGTTLVEQILASHAHVYGAGELNDLHGIVASRFTRIDDAGLAESLIQADSAAFSRAGGDYIDMIKARADSVGFITDKMPLNFRLIGMIRLMLPKAKIIHCCRDPRDTCLSIFKNYFSREGNYYAYDLGELGRYYTLYRDLMRHWHSVLPGFIYDIHYEDVVADQEGQSRALLAHCTLEWDDACLAFHKTDRPVHTASAVQVRRPIYKDSIQSWKRYETQLAPLFEALS
jgi:tetratricopeptide (TPR) repeat protein